MDDVVQQNNILRYMIKRRSSLLVVYMLRNSTNFDMSTECVRQVHVKYTCILCICLALKEREVITLMQPLCLCRVYILVVYRALTSLYTDISMESPSRTWSTVEKPGKKLANALTWTWLRKTCAREMLELCSGDILPPCKVTLFGALHVKWFSMIGTPI